MHLEKVSRAREELKLSQIVLILHSLDVEFSVPGNEMDVESLRSMEVNQSMEWDAHIPVHV